VPAGTSTCGTPGAVEPVEPVEPPAPRRCLGPSSGLAAARRFRCLRWPRPELAGCPPGGAPGAPWWMPPLAGGVGLPPSPLDSGGGVLPPSSTGGAGVPPPSSTGGVGSGLGSGLGDGLGDGQGVGVGVGVGSAGGSVGSGVGVGVGVAHGSDASCVGAGVSAGVSVEAGVWSAVWPTAVPVAGPSIRMLTSTVEARPRRRRLGRGSVSERIANNCLNRTFPQPFARPLRHSNNRQVLPSVVSEPLAEADRQLVQVT
jgi:hypothetical protein